LVGGQPVTPGLTAEMAFSDVYMEASIGFVIPDFRRDDYRSLADLERREELHVAVPDLPYFVALAGRLLPASTIHRVPSARSFFTGDVADALLYSAESGSAWSLIYPQYAVVVPSDLRIRVPVALGLPHNQPELTRYIDAWIDLTRATQLMDRLNRYWILGENIEAVEPRWSILRNVLGWGRNPEL
ncbi:MAG: hypothetical protein ACWGPN_16380, partial [Gammaproteobacteria bacterium]